jgi:hypothetical protein
MINDAHLANRLKQMLCVPMLVGALLASLIGVNVANAQDSGLVDDSTYVFETGEEVAWNSPWVFNEEFSGVDDPLESVFLDTRNSSLIVVTLPSSVDVEEVRDIFLEGLTGETEKSLSIDKGTYDGLSYSLDLMSLEGIEFGSFTLFRAGSGDTPTVAHIILSPRDVFASEFASAQAEVSVDGSGLFPGVGGQGLQDLLDANAGQAPEDDEQPAETPEDEETEQPAETPEADDEEGPGTGGLKNRGDDDPVEETPEDDPAEETPEDDPVGGTGESGLIDDSTFVSPTFGSELAWDSTWELDPDREIVVDDGGIDFISLIWTGDGPGFVTVSFVPSAGSDVAGYVDYWQTEDYLDQVAFSAESSVLLAESSATVGAVARVDYTDEGTEVLFYREAHLDEDNETIVIIEYSTSTQFFEPGLADAQAGVELNGAGVLDFFTVEEILEEV